MNNQQNMHLKGEEANRGNTVDYFRKMKQTISINDGTRQFSPKTVSSHDQSTPFGSDEVTYITITHKDHHISQISEGYLNLTVKYMLSLSGIPASFTDVNKYLKLFVGHKSSNQIMYQMWIRSKNNETGYEQNQMIREGFAMATIQDECSKASQRYVHSLYENVANYNQFICGEYIDVQDFKDGLSHEVEIKYVIPFDDLAALQAFDQYPNKVVGDIELKFYVRDLGLVWCMVDPRKVMDVREMLQDEQPTETIINAPIFDHKFSQIGAPANIVNKIVSDEVVDGLTKLTLSSGQCILHCNSMTVTRCEANMKGFKICSKSLAEIHDIFTEPVYIMAQELNYNAWATAADANGLQSTLNTALSNVTSMEVVFPKRASDLTVFENPCIDNFYIKTLGVQYPDKIGSTLDARFLQDQLIAADLDGNIKATRELVDSYTMNRNGPDGIRYKNCLSDCTSFCAIIQTERNGSGRVFDGIDSGGQSVPIEIGFRPIFNGLNDTYYNVDAAGSYHPPAPQLWLVRDTYWMVDVEHGLTYKKYGTPPELEIRDY